ncbi:hypothetical protein [uncultured Williamsia sp.]|uniref:hypothetical protein n=1 Tax=uncultured Williamsia sp. TaxID=259311 RepID=UPI00263A01DA|nr:hypothetical protein [uncultured Williamsia sp.]
MDEPDPLTNRIPHDDWADQDLLTKGEAAERVAAEIDAVRAEIIGGMGGAEPTDSLQKRLEALQAAYRSLTGTD